MEDAPAIFSTSEALRFGWEKTKTNLKPLLILGFAAAFLALLNQGLSRPHGYGDPVLLLFVQALQVGVAMLFARAALRIHDGQPVLLAKLGEMLKGYLTFFAATLICELIVGFGLVLLIVPGLIWAARFGFAPMLVLDRELDPIEALKESSRIGEGLRWPLIKFGLALVGINLLGAIAAGLGLFLSIPVSFLAGVHVLRALQVHRPALAAGFHPTPAPSH